MIKHFYILFIFLIYSVVCLSQNICAEYTGYGTANNINGNETYSYTRNSGSWSNITIKVPMTSSESLEHNSKTISNKYVSSNINPDSYNVEYDSFGNEMHVLTFSGNPSVISLTREYNATVYNNIPENDCFSDNFPVSGIPGDILQYLDPTTSIQSNNSSIISLAQSITNGCTSMHQAVEKIAEWVRGYISYNTNNNIPQDAVTILNRKDGNCRGFTNISIALLRSVGIPARYVSGGLLPKSYTIPFRTNGHITMGTNGPAFHATHEIYYPLEGNWVCGDGQSSVHFTSVNFIKTNHARDGSETTNKIML
jgi:transglutaminase-like putative cysteine protease